MSVRVIGSILILICGFAFGYGKKRRFSLKTEVINGILHAIDLIHAEIQCMRTPTDVLLEKLCNQDNEIINAFFKKCNESHKTHGELPFFDVWQKVLNDVENMGLNKNETDTFNEVGNCLGRYEAEEQLRILANTRSRFEGYLEIAEDEKDRLGRLYGNLSVLTCVALVIILL